MKFGTTMNNVFVLHSEGMRSFKDIWDIWDFTQIPMYKKISQDTGLTAGFDVTIRFDGEYKKLSRKEVKAAYMERLRLMNIPLGSAYFNPINIGMNTITRNWAGFIKIHLQHPKRDGWALL